MACFSRIEYMCASPTMTVRGGLLRIMVTQVDYDVNGIAMLNVDGITLVTVDVNIIVD